MTRTLVEAVTSHHGHAGRVLANHLCRDVDVSSLRARYEVLREQGRQASDRGVGHRLADYGAAILLAGEVVAAAGLPTPDLDRVAQVLDDAIKRGEAESDRPRAALDALLSWVLSNPRKMVGMSTEEGQPHGGYLGRYEPGKHVSVVAEIARDYLERRSFDVEGAIRAWAERGWLWGHGGHTTATVSLDGPGRPRCLRVYWSVVVDLLGPQGEEER